MDHLSLTDMSNQRQIVPGITVTASGQATVDPAMAETLFDLAIAIEEPTDLPVDVQHVLAAIVLAARKGDIDVNKPISSADPSLIRLLAGHVKSIFTDYGGEVGTDD